ncbi:hypothetical protein [Pseudobacteriovorax antillogorgiicola]|uniref:Uncharacterized protein n=1 Tax=Pseudobacteriovorax antillogorgiicola TaxID=1513793 RepID=A0A1Y6BZI9_9BACT|nr:hypothetical protein [Pseudobacteriovorax antillogorgiicola]TCS51185.1 hypothetical protein EDD56_11169 [Pseudobacteriovorax antillogorgiicola]SMF37656.1 hypothetical protein SAMN06296036_111109 [Pseudobacteriovorax antillogorgiicola]
MKDFLPSVLCFCLLLHSCDLKAEDLSMYPSMEATNSYWRDAKGGEPVNVNTFSLRLKGEWGDESLLGVFDVQGECQSGSHLDNHEPCAGEVIEAFNKWETDTWSFIVGRYSYRIGSGISTNPSQPERTGMRNDQGPFVVDRGSDMLKISAMIHGELSLGAMTIFEKDRDLMVPYVTIDHEGDTLQSRTIVGQRFFGQNLSATPLDFLVVYLEYNLHKRRDRETIYSDGLLGTRMGIGNLPLSLGLELIRISHGLNGTRSRDYLEGLDRGDKRVSLGTRYDSYDHRKPGSNDTFIWGASQWLSRDLLYINAITHFGSPWSPIIRGYHSLSDSSSISIIGVQYSSLTSDQQLTASMDLESFHGDTYSEWGRVEDQVHQSTLSLRLGFRW